MNNKINHIIGLLKYIRDFEISLTENERKFLSEKISKGDEIYIKYIRFLNCLNSKLEKKLNVNFQCIEKDMFEKLDLVRYSMRNALVTMKHVYLLSSKVSSVKL